MNRVNSNHPTLRHAAAAGNAPSVQKLLRAGAAVDELDNAPLRRALRHGHSNTVQLLLAAGADWAENSKEFLQLAAKNRNARNLKLLLQASKSAIPQDILNLTLTAALMAGNLQSVTTLIAAGADPRANNDLSAALAATAGSVQILKILRAHGVNFNPTDGQVLFNAIVADELDAARYIIASGANVNARTNIAVTMAVVSGQAEMLEMLMNAGGKLPHPSLIADAADSDSVESLLVLVRHGCDFHGHADAITQSAARHDGLRVLKYVLQNSKVSQNTLNGALPAAVEKASESVVDLLLHHGADASAHTSYALLNAVKSQKITIARKLIIAGARAKDLDASALVATVKANNWPFLAELLQLGMPVTGVVLATDDAAKFFRHISPAVFTQDTAGQLLPRNIRKQRNGFAQANGGVASKKSTDDAIFYSQWFADFIRRQGGHV